MLLFYESDPECEDPGLFFCMKKDIDRSRNLEDNDNPSNRNTGGSEYEI